MIDNEEIILRKHDLKLAIQKAIIDHRNSIAITDDIGYRSWMIASEVVDKVMTKKQVKRTINEKIKDFLNKLLINN